MRAIGSKPRAAGSSKDPGDDGNDSTDERFQRAPSQRGENARASQLLPAFAGISLSWEEYFNILTRIFPI